MYEVPEQSPERDQFMADQRSEFEPTERWVRVKLGGETIADSKRVMLLRQSGSLAVYYFPQADVRMDLLEASEHTLQSKRNGEAIYWHVKVGDREARNAAWSYSNPPETAPPLDGYIAFKWNMMDQWYEEEEEVFVHARDPYHRVDTMPSSRHVKVVINGEVVAETQRPHLLFETNLPTRYYIPQEDVRMDLLEATKTNTACPYKGVASYWTATIGGETYHDIVWGYPDPIPEAPKIKGLLCFYNEKVDLYVDGELKARPQTMWS